MRRVEMVYLALGLGIIGYGTIDHGLTVTELGAAMFLIGLVPVRRLDQHHQRMISPELEHRIEGWLSQRSSSSGTPGSSDT